MNSAASDSNQTKMGNQHTKLTDEELSALVSDPEIKCKTQENISGENFLYN